MFVRHRYTVNELLESNHLSKVESIAGKIRDDVRQWEGTGRLSNQIRATYNQNAERVHQRVERIIEKIKTRAPTIWEQVCAVFIKAYRVIAEMFLPLIKIRFLSANKRLKLKAA